MRINLLGSCQVVWQGHPLTILRRQTRALLYLLAARLEPIPRARIAFLFWPDMSDAIARRHLTRLLSGLRAVLPLPNLLLTDEESVALNPALVQSDSQQLAAASVSGDLTVLEAAVACYRGPFMAGFSLPNAPEYEIWQMQTARHLDAHYLTLLEQLAVRYASAGDLPAAIRAVQRYLATDELAEAMHRRLIGLYLAAGDCAAAQRQYEQCALILERELGVSPLPETRAALQAAPPGPLESGTPLVLQSSEPPLIGRAVALAQLLDACQRLSAGGLILIHGAPGVGKTRLMREFAARYAGRGVTLSGGCYPASQSLPYHPLLQALRSSLARTDLWNVVPATWLSELLPLLPDLHTVFPNLPAPLPAAPAQARARVWTALTHILTALARCTPLLLCLEDLQWADEDTLGWLRYLAGCWVEAPLLLMTTAHSRSAPNLASLWLALSRTGRLVEIELRGLAVDEVQSLLAAAVSMSLPAELAQRVHQISGGNPFFVLEIARELENRGQLDTPPDDLPLPATVYNAVMERVAHLTPMARQVLEAAAVLDPLLDDGLLQYTSARSVAETADALDELLVYQFLQIGPAGALAFSHRLIQMALYRALTPWRRRLLHRRAGDALAQLQPHSAALLAHHFTEAGAWSSAVAYLAQAAQQSARAAAYETALDLVERAIALLPRLPRPEAEHLALLRQRLALQRVLVRLPAWQIDALEVLRLAAAARDDAARLEGLEAQISLFILLSDFAQAEATAGEALALARQRGDQVAEARVRQTLGWHLTDALGRSAEGLAHLEMACRLAEAAGADDVLYRALCNLAFAWRAEGRCQAARTRALQALSLTAYRPGDLPQPAFADALRELGEANAYLGRWEEARTQLRPLLDLYRTLDDPWAHGTLLYNYGLYSSNMGQHADAIDAMRRLVALSEAVGLPADSDYGVWHRAGLVRVLLAAGAVAEAGALLDSLDASKLAPGRPYLAWAKAAAEVRLATGDAAAALAIVQPAATWWRAHATPHDADVLLLLAQAAWASRDAVLAGEAVAAAGNHLAMTDLRRYHVRLHAVRYLVTGDPAALAAARNELEMQAAHFSDPALRAAFLQEVALHRWVAHESMQASRRPSLISRPPTPTRCSDSCEL